VDTELLDQIDKDDVKIKNFHFFRIFWYINIYESSILSGISLLDFSHWTLQQLNIQCFLLLRAILLEKLALGKYFDP